MSIPSAGLGPARPDHINDAADGGGQDHEYDQKGQWQNEGGT